MNFETLTDCDLKEIVRKFHDNLTLSSDLVEIIIGVKIIIGVRTEQKRRESKNYKPQCPVSQPGMPG